MRGIAEIQRKYSGGYARTTVEQNFVLRWVRDESIYEVWQALSELGLGEGGSGEIIDTVSCPGTDSCKLGITSSMGLNAAINKRLKELDITDELTKRIHIKNSGCPNGCSQHHIANIGFYGASIKVGDKTIPAYIPHIGGNYESGEVIYGTRLKSRLPSKRVPDAVERWLKFYEAEREEGEEFNAFAERVGPDSFTEVVKDLSHARGVQRGEHGLLHRLAARRALPGDPGRGRVRGVATQAEAVLERALAEHHPRIALACSFQKEESVLVHMLLQQVPDPRVFTIDTGVLFPETYATWREFEERFGLKVEVFDATSPGRAMDRRATAAAPRRSLRSTRRWAAWTRGSPACAASRRPRAPRPPSRPTTRPAACGSSTR